MKVPRGLRKDVSEAALDAIARRVKEAESLTSGEIVVHLVHNLLPLEKPRARALRAFRELGVHRTTRRNGVLLFVVMKKRRFEIVTDEGVQGSVDADVWPAIAARMSDQIAEEGFEKGICGGVALIGEVLAKHFPREPGDVDELSDRPSVERN